ncbi:MAG: DUF2793 domain-containing protein [Sphingomonas sp.]
MNDDTSARLRLPHLQPGQAQKELYHNEALALIDIGLQASVKAVGLESPPSDPKPGECWIVGPAPTGVWSGQAKALAGWTAGGWRFVAPVAGMTVWSEQDRLSAQYESDAWHVGELRTSVVMIAELPVVGARQPAIGTPQGGLTVDTQARAALSAILVALRSHGLIAP